MLPHQIFPCRIEAQIYIEYAKRMEIQENTVLNYEQYKIERKNEFVKTSYGMYFGFENVFSISDVKNDEINFDFKNELHITFLCIQCRSR